MAKSATGIKKVDWKSIGIEVDKVVI